LGTRALKEVIFANGHENVLATHRTTMEVTKDHDLSKKGTCIIAVSANKGMNELSSEFKRKLKDADAKLTIRIAAGDIEEIVNASGSPQLALTDSTELVIRKSNYVCSRTLATQADKAACDLSKDLVRRLKNPAQKIVITLALES
jgi:hypothetical protein